MSAHRCLTNKHAFCSYDCRVHVQAKLICCTTNSTSRHRLLLKILQVTQTQTTAVSLLQVTRVGDSHGARTNTVLSVSQVSGQPVDRSIGFTDGRDDIPLSPL